MKPAIGAWYQFHSLGIGGLGRLKQIMCSLGDALAANPDPLTTVELLQAAICEIVAILGLPSPRFLLEHSRPGLVAYGPLLEEDVWEVAFRPQSIAAVTSLRRRVRKLLRSMWNVAMNYLAYHHDGWLTFLVLEQFAASTAHLCEVETLWRPTVPTMRRVMREQEWLCPEDRRDRFDGNGFKGGDGDRK